MNIIAVVCARNLSDRELCSGFLASKGFNVVTVDKIPNPITLPMAVIIDSIGKVKGVATSCRKASREPVRIIAVQVSKRADRKSPSVAELYHIVPSSKNVSLFLALEGIVRKEKGLSRGSKPKPTIAVPV